ncbi:MAG: hypothetical protein JOZ96_17185 [Acidobacteria bacterium]|nr:hypothetical protein [Acidobacteriota bacterium]
MSYLDWPRINFTGRFFTNVSTINNDLDNYDPSAPVPDPGWNPNGIALFKFDSCKVTGVQAAGDDGKLVGAPVTTLSKPAAGKLVDLDPDDQSLSQVIGVAVSLKTAAGSGFQGALEPCNLQDMWTRSPVPKGNAGGSRAGAVFVSTLNSVQWTKADDVKALKLLRDATQNSQLAIRFAVGSYFFADPDDPTSGFGTLVGSIGPRMNGDPVQFVRRRLLPAAAAQAAGLRSAAHVESAPPAHAEFEVQKGAKRRAAAPLPPLQFQACNFQLDAANRRLSLDLANSIQLASFAGPPRQVGQLRAVIVAADGKTEEVLQPKPFEFTDATNQTQGGVVDVSLTQGQSQKLEAMRAGVELKQSGGAWQLILAEHSSGMFANISPFTARVVGGESFSFGVQAFQWGKPLPNQTLGLTAESTQGTPDSLSIQGDGSGTAVTDQNGLASFNVNTPTNLDIPDARQQLDSLCYVLTGPWANLNGGILASRIPPAGLLVWAPYANAGMTDPTWEGQVQPIFDEYMRIYPGMKEIMDLTDLTVVQANLQKLLSAMSLPFEAPHRMPVTRDLSPQKIQVIITWLKNQLAQQAGKT